MVDGIPASSLSAEELSSLIFGLEGTKIRLSIEREDEGFPNRFDVTVTRGPADPNGNTENGRAWESSHKESNGEHKRGILHSLVAMLKILQSLDLPLESDRPPMTDETSRTREGKLVNFVFQEVKMLKQHQFVAHQLIQTLRDALYAQQDIASDGTLKEALKAYDKQTELMCLDAFKNHKSGGGNIYSSFGSKFSETSLGASEQAAEEIDAALAASEHDSLRLQNTILKMDIVRKDRELTALKQKQSVGQGNEPRDRSQQNAHNGENNNSIQHLAQSAENLVNGKILTDVLPDSDFGGSSIKYGNGQENRSGENADGSGRQGVQTILPLKAGDMHPPPTSTALPADPVQWSPKVQKNVSRFNDTHNGDRPGQAFLSASRDIQQEAGDAMRTAAQKLNSAPPSPLVVASKDPLPSNSERMERRWPPPNSNALVPPPSTPVIHDPQSLSLQIPEKKFSSLFPDAATPPLHHEAQPGRLEHLLERSKRLTSEASEVLSGRPPTQPQPPLASKTSPLTRQAVEELLEGDRHLFAADGAVQDPAAADPVLDRIRRWQKDLPAPRDFNLNVPSGFQDAGPRALPVGAASAASHGGISKPPPPAPINVRTGTPPTRTSGDGAMPWDLKPPESPLSLTGSEKKMRSVEEIKARRTAYNQAQDSLLKELSAALPTDSSLRPPRDPSIRQPSSTPSKLPSTGHGTDSGFDRDPGRVPMPSHNSDLPPPRPNSSPSNFPLAGSLSGPGSSPMLGHAANPPGYPGSLDEGRLSSITSSLQNLRSSDSQPSTAFMRHSDSADQDRGGTRPLRASDDVTLGRYGRQSAFSSYSNRRTTDGLDAAAPSRSERGGGEELVPPWERQPSQPAAPVGMRASDGGVPIPAPPTSLLWQDVASDRKPRDPYTPPAPPSSSWQDVAPQRPPPPPSFQRSTPPPPSAAHNVHHAPPPPPPVHHAPPPPAMNQTHSLRSHSPVLLHHRAPVQHPPSPYSHAIQPSMPAPAPGHYPFPPSHHTPDRGQFVQHRPPAHRPPMPAQALGGGGGDFQLLSVRTVQSNVHLKPGPRVWGDTACWA